MVEWQKKLKKPTRTKNESIFPYFFFSISLHIIRDSFTLKRQKQPTDADDFFFAVYKNDETNSE
jgi:hypothetical protein